MGSIPVGDSVSFFFVPRSRHVDYSIFSRTLCYFDFFALKHNYSPFHCSVQTLKDDSMAIIPLSWFSPEWFATDKAMV